jgi:thymidylate synthase (FAD)
MTEIEFVTKPSATLVQTNASDEMVAMAAWVSFDRDSEERLEDKPRMQGLINFLMREKHMSPFEHGSFTFKIDCPIFVAREFHRHRTMAYNEVSGRYTEMKPRFYVPGDSRPVVQKGKAGNYHFEEDPVNLKLAQASIKVVTEQAWAGYRAMLKDGTAKEVARMALPNNLMTQFYATVNPRNLMHFLGLRSSEQALYEIREVAYDMEVALQEAMPMTYMAWKQNTGPGYIIGKADGSTGNSTGPRISFSNGDFIAPNEARLSLGLEPR